MQVDIEELYAALEEKGVAPPMLPGSPSTAPSEVVMPPTSAVPQQEPARAYGAKEYMLIALVALVAAAAAWGLSQVVFGEPDPAPDPAGTMELGPIELSE